MTDRFLVNIEWLNGGRDIDLSLEQAALFSADPKAAVAQRLGVGPDEYEAWLAARGRVQCCGKTTKGRRCRNSLTGIVVESPRAWLDHPPQYCEVHSGLK